MKKLFSGMLKLGNYKILIVQRLVFFIYQEQCGEPTLNEVRKMMAYLENEGFIDETVFVSNSLQSNHFDTI